MTQKVVLTSLDWVMGAESAFLAQVKLVLAALRDKEVAVVGYTGCDRAEVEPIRAELDWHDPFMTESGSAIFTPVAYNPFPNSLGELDDPYFVEALGCPYVQARAGLRVLANLISHPLKGFGDFTVPQLEKFMKVEEDVAHRAKAREFSEPFMTPKAVETAALIDAAKEMGFDVVLRDPEVSRFSDLVGAGVSVAAAAARVVAAYGADEVAVVGAEEDVDAIAAETWRKIVVRSQADWLDSLKQI